MIHKIAIVGPEASGKTALAKQLALHFKDVWVPEFARKYLEAQAGVYEKGELDYIAKKQVETEKNNISAAKQFLFCDTNPLVVKIWSLYKYGSCSKEILDLVEESNYSLQFLLKPDLNYSNDPLRENPSLKDRNELFAIYENELIKSNENYAVIDGFGENRFINAINVLQETFY